MEIQYGGKRSPTVIIFEPTAALRITDSFFIFQPCILAWWQLRARVRGTAEVADAVSFFKQFRNLSVIQTRPRFFVGLAGSFSGKYQKLIDRRVIDIEWDAVRI